jgi:hypothetical protein
MSIPGKHLLRPSFFRTISLPVSSTIFNRTLTNKVESLPISLLLKAVILSDPTKVHLVVPAEVLPVVLDALVASIQKTFLFGLCCSIVCAISFYLVPWLPLIALQETSETRGSDSPPRLLGTPQTTSETSNRPRYPPLSTVSDKASEISLGMVNYPARCGTTWHSGIPMSFSRVEPPCGHKLDSALRYSV